MIHKTCIYSRTRDLKIKKTPRGATLIFAFSANSLKRFGTNTLYLMVTEETGL